MNTVYQEMWRPTKKWGVRGISPASCWFESDRRRQQQV